jgi:TatD DNase family protein
VPFRGKRNETAYIRYVAEKIAILKDIDFKEVDEITTQNAKKIFRF